MTEILEAKMVLIGTYNKEKCHIHTLIINNLWKSFLLPLSCTDAGPPEIFPDRQWTMASQFAQSFAICNTWKKTLGWSYLISCVEQ